MHLTVACPERPSVFSGLPSTALARLANTCSAPATTTCSVDASRRADAKPRAAVRGELRAAPKAPGRAGVPRPSRRRQYRRGGRALESIERVAALREKELAIGRYALCLSEPLPRSRKAIRAEGSLERRTRRAGWSKTSDATFNLTRAHARLLQAGVLQAQPPCECSSTTWLRGPNFSSRDFASGPRGSQRCRNLPCGRLTFVRTSANLRSHRRQRKGDAR